MFTVMGADQPVKETYLFLGVDSTAQASAVFARHQLKIGAGVGVHTDGEETTVTSKLTLPANV